MHCDFSRSSKPASRHGQVIVALTSSQQLLYQLNNINALQVIQPQEGSRVVACAESRYEFEVFSGTVVGSPNSEALNAGENFLKKLLGFGKSTCQATHEMVVRTPDGVSRTFRFGTTSADVPAQVCHPGISLFFLALSQH